MVSEDSIVDDIVVTGTCFIVKKRMGLERKVPVASLGDRSVADRAAECVATLACIGITGRVESGMLVHISCCSRDRVREPT
jgi:hypothetical protein